MIPESLFSVANHLWQSTLFCGVAGLLALALRKNSARVRYWVWVAASWKFLVPFSALIALGGHVPSRSVPAPAHTNLSVALDQVSEPFMPPIVSSPFSMVVPPAPDPLPAILFAVWACGFVGIGCSWLLRWRRIAVAVRTGSPVQLGLPVKTVSPSSLLEPGIFGLFRPVLLLPKGIVERLTPIEMKAVIAHELCHVRHRDNVIAATQMFMEAVFWFYPLIWWIGKQMVQERERGCDEEVLRRGCDPAVYAKSILGVCEFYLESPLACMSGVISQANLKSRIEAILENRVVPRLNVINKVAIAVAGIASLATPIAIGVLNPPYVRAQPPSAQGAGPLFEVASVRQNKSQTGVDRIRNANGTFLVENFSLKRIIGMAYGVEEGRDYLFSGPKWLDEDSFDIQARYAPETSASDVLRMLQNVLAERFHLRVHRESREFSAYALVTAKGGPKIHARAVGANDRPTPQFRVQPGNVSASSITLSMLADRLSRPAFQLDRQVVDFTGLTGYFDLTLDWTPVGAADNPSGGPSIFTALEEQLGLKLESRRIPIDVLIIDNVERVPSPN